MQNKPCLPDAIVEALPSNAQYLLRPTRNVDQVHILFGVPGRSITRWDHADFSVYFEYNRVLDSVVHRPNGAQQ